MSRKSEKTRQKRAERRDLISKLVGSTCTRCENDFPVEALDFHHRDHTEKEQSISQMLTHSWDNILDEIAKCDLVCACCHRIIHAEERKK